MNHKYTTIGIILGIILGIITIGGLYTTVDSSVYCQQYPNRCAQGEMQSNDMFQWLELNPFPIGGNTVWIVLLVMAPGLIGFLIEYKQNKNNIGDSNKT